MYFNSYGQLVPDDYLAHHGIQGQKWGVRNGPPYPLSPGDHSAREVRYKGQNAGKLESWRGRRAAKATGRYENWKAKKLSGIDKKYDRKIARIDKKIAGTKNTGKLESLKSKRAELIFKQSVKESKVLNTTEAQYKTRRRVKTALAVVGGVSVAALGAYLANKYANPRGQHMAKERWRRLYREADKMDNFPDFVRKYEQAETAKDLSIIYETGTTLQKFLAQMGSYTGKGLKAASEAGNAVSNAARGLSKDAGKVLNDAGRTISTAAGEVGKRAGDVVNKAGGAISTAAGEVGKRGGRVLDDAGRTISNVAGQASKVAGDVAKNARNVAGEVGGRIGDVVDDARRAAEIAGNRAGRVLRDVGKNAGGLIDSAGRAISTAASTASNVAGNAMKTAGKITGNISASANRFLDYVGDNAKYVMRDVTSAANKAGKSVESWTNSAFKQVENLYNSGFTPEQIAKKIGTTASTAWEMVEQLTGRK